MEEWLVWESRRGPRMGTVDTYPVDRLTGKVGRCKDMGLHTDMSTRLEAQHTDTALDRAKTGIRTRRLRPCTKDGARQAPRACCQHNRPCRRRPHTDPLARMTMTTNTTTRTAEVRGGGRRPAGERVFWASAGVCAARCRGSARADARAAAAPRRTRRARGAHTRAGRRAAARANRRL